MGNPDINLEISRLQNDISRTLDLSQNRLVFDFSQEKEGVRLDLVTINPRHDQSFLFHSVVGKSKLDALEEMVDYVQQNFRKERSYTVQWARGEASDLHTSYFRATDIYEVLEKFGHGREMSDYTIYAITLNPVA